MYENMFDTENKQDLKIGKYLGKWLCIFNKMVIKETKIVL